jgi:mono/diheme cytochrome c family protein
MKKPLLSIVAISTLLTLGAVQWLAAEGKHAHKHENKQQDETNKIDDHKHMGHGKAHWASPKDAAARANPIKSDVASIERGKNSYVQFCVSCHGAKAMGDGPAAVSLNPKPTNLKAMSGGHPDGDFAWKIANGRGAMPAWKTVLTENQTWDLVNYIQDLKNHDGSEKNANHGAQTHKDTHAH